MKEGNNEGWKAGGKVKRRKGIKKEWEQGGRESRVEKVNKGRSLNQKIMDG